MLLSFLDTIKEYIQGKQALAINGDGKPAEEEAKIAIAVVLLEIACGDGELHEKEASLIHSILIRELGIEGYEAEEMVNYATRVSKNGSEFEDCITAINEAYNDEQKRYILTLLWKVVYADNIVKEFEMVLAEHVRSQLGLSEEDGEQSRKDAERIF